MDPREQLYKFSPANLEILEAIRIRLASSRPSRGRTLWHRHELVDVTPTADVDSSAKEPCAAQRDSVDDCDVIILPSTQFTQQGRFCQSQPDSQETDEPLQGDPTVVAKIVSDMKKALLHLDPTADGAFSPNTLAAFQSVNPIELGLIIGELQLVDVPDATLTKLCDALTWTLDKEPSLGWCTAFMNHCFLPKVCSLRQEATRPLTGSIRSLTNKFPRAVVEGFMVPCVAMDTVGVFQCEVVGELFKDCLPTEHRHLFMQKFCQSKIALNECLVTFVQFVLDSKFEFDEGVLDALILLVINSAPSLMSNLKFIKLILNCIREFGDKLTERQCLDLDAAIETNETILKNACQATLKKMIQRKKQVTKEII